MLLLKIKRNALELSLVVAFLVSAGIAWATAHTGHVPVTGLISLPGEITLGHVVQVDAIPFDYQLQNRGGGKLSSPK
jgi:hypothetical protein